MLKNVTWKGYYKSGRGFRDGGMIQLYSSEFEASIGHSDANEH